jgi:hypothetical protein
MRKPEGHAAGCECGACYEYHRWKHELIQIAAAPPGWRMAMLFVSTSGAVAGAVPGTVADAEDIWLEAPVAAWCLRRDGTPVALVTDSERNFNEEDIEEDGQDERVGFLAPGEERTSPRVVVLEQASRARQTKRRSA